MISPKKSLWHCLGACQAGGSVIDWVMRDRRCVVSPCGGTAALGSVAGVRRRGEGLRGPGQRRPAGQVSRGRPPGHRAPDHLTWASSSAVTSTTRSARSSTGRTSPTTGCTSSPVTSAPRWVTFSLGLFHILWQQDLRVDALEEVKRFTRLTGPTSIWILFERSTSGTVGKQMKRIEGTLISDEEEDETTIGRHLSWKGRDGTMRLSRIARERLKAAGWLEGRDTSRLLKSWLNKLSREGQFRISEAAQAALREFGGSKGISRPPPSAERCTGTSPSRVEAVYPLTTGATSDAETIRPPTTSPTSDAGANRPLTTSPASDAEAICPPTTSPTSDAGADVGRQEA